MCPFHCCHKSPIVIPGVIWSCVLTLSEKKKNWNTGFPWCLFPVPLNGLWVHECTLVRVWTKSRKKVPCSQWALARGSLGSSGLCFVPISITSWEDILTSLQSPKVRRAYREEAGKLLASLSVLSFPTFSEELLVFLVPFLQLRLSLPWSSKLHSDPLEYQWKMRVHAMRIHLFQQYFLSNCYTGGKIWHLRSMGFSKTQSLPSHVPRIWLKTEQRGQDKEKKLQQESKKRNVTW